MFDEVLALLDWLKKKKKNSKGASLWKQPLDNLPCKMLKFIHIASSSGINKAITCENNCLSNLCFVSDSCL